MRMISWHLWERVIATLDSVCSDTVQRYNRKWYNAVTTSARGRRVEKQILALVSRFARLAHELYRIASGGDHEADDEGASLEDC